MTLPILTHRRGDERYYTLAYFNGVYPQTSGDLDATLHLTVKVDEPVASFAFIANSLGGDELLFATAIAYPGPIEAALIEGWNSYSVPIFYWRLAQAPEILAGDLQDRYSAVRKALCLAIYEPRVKAWTRAQLNAGPLFMKSDAAFELVDPFAPTPENEEIFSAASAG